MRTWNAEPTEAPGAEASLTTWRMIGAYQVYPDWSRKGSAGTVYAAINRVLRSPVALKVLEGPSIERELLGVRLVHRVTGNAPHRHLIPILHAELEKPNGNPYYAMPLADDLVNGEVVSWIPEGYRPKTLDAYLRSLPGPLPLAEALYVAEQVLLALLHLHAESLAHCDVKPSNIFFLGGAPGRGRWLLGDFGSAVHYGPAETWYLGTPGYMPPERTASPKVDVHALGKTLFRMLSSGLADADPFEAFREGRLPLPIPDEHQEELRDLLLRACSRDIEGRLTAGELWEAVRALQQRAGMTRRVEMTLDWDFDRVKEVLPLDLDLTSEQLDRLTEGEARDLVRLLLKVRTLVTPLNTEVSRGSVIVRLELTRAEAEHLEAAIESGAFAEFPLRRAPARDNPFARESFPASLSRVVRKALPEDPEDLPTEEAPRAETWRARFRRTCRNWRFWLGTAILTAGLFLALALPERLLSPFRRCPFLRGTPLALAKVPDVTAEAGSAVPVRLVVRRFTYSGPVRLLLSAHDGVDVRADPVTLPAGADRATAVLHVGPDVRPDVYRIDVRPYVGEKALEGQTFSLTVLPARGPACPGPETSRPGKASLPVHAVMADTGAKGAAGRYHAP